MKAAMILKFSNYSLKFAVAASLNLERDFLDIRCIMKILVSPAF